MIESITHDGRGIAAVNGKKVFVAGALAGEQVRFLRRKARRNYDEAELLEVLQPSPDRIDARCEAFGRCGGCSLQHVTMEQQRQIKFQTLKDNFERIGNVQPERWLDAITGPDWNYRRRGRLAVKDVSAKGRVLVGFRERHAPFITDMHRCEVLAKPVDGLIDALSELIGALSISSRLPQIEVAVAENAAALVFRVLDPPTAADEALLRTFAGDHGIRVYLQPGGLDSVFRLGADEEGEDDENDEPLYYSLPDFDVRIAIDPVGFVQINEVVNRKMVSAAVELLEVGPDDRVLDLYCGIGNFSLPLARRAGTVLGVEGDSTLVVAANNNAERNHLRNATFRLANLDEIVGTEPWIKQGWNKVLLDPARNGAAEVIKHLRNAGATRIVYVSCHPGTLARDAGTLVHEHGYRLTAAGIIDMFPHTAHVESIAVFDKV